MSFSKHSMDMTQGPIWSQLAVFALPILLGEVFQQSYSIIDSAIVGNYVGDVALAAVGASDTFTRIIIGFFSGVSVGFTVLVAQAFGRKNKEDLRNAVHTIILLSIVLGLMLSIAGVLMIDLTLKLMDVPSEVHPLLRGYLKIYFAGISGVVVYNALTGILRAVGDSRHPLYYLIGSSLLNIALDYIFVAKLGLGINGAAYATILAQMLAALACLFQMMHVDADWRFSWQGAIDSRVLRAMFTIGFPIGLQKSIVQLSNLIVLSHISHFGAECLAGWVVYSKVSHTLTITAQSITSAETTFISQNIGARQLKRAEQGVRDTLLGGLALEGVLIVLVLLFRSPIISIFGAGEETTAFASAFLGLILPLQIAHVFMSVYISVLRGGGKALVGTIFMILGLVVTRQIYLMIIRQLWYTPMTAGFAYPVGWLTAGILTYGYYRFRLRTSLYVQTS